MDVIVERRGQQRRTWKEVMDEEAGLQKRSDGLTYEAVKSGKLSEGDFMVWVNELRNQATRDKLTGLENRREFLDRMNREFNESDAPLSVVEIDIDHFKEFNDTFGHPIGDEVLKCLGAIALNMGLQIGGRFYRVGGEELMVILPNTKGEQLTEAVRTIGNNFIGGWADDERLKKQKVGRITVSMGGCTKKPNEELSDFLERIDRYLYTAKRTDGNKVGRQRAVVDSADGQLTEVSFRE